LPFYEWTRAYNKALTLSRGGRLAGIEPVVSTIVTDNPIQMEFGPDGVLYLLEYGNGFYLENPVAQLARIDFVRGNYPPVPKVAANPTVGLAPLAVSFSSAATSDPDGDRLAYAWDFNADGAVDSTEPNPTYTFTRNGVFDATLRMQKRTPTRQPPTRCTRRRSPRLRQRGLGGPPSGPVNCLGRRHQR
jgi:PKD repeat protein